MDLRAIGRTNTGLWLCLVLVPLLTPRGSAALQVERISFYDAVHSVGGPLQLEFPAALVSPPTPEQEAEWSRLDRKSYVDLARVLVPLLALFALLWMLVGRDPPRQPAVVRYEPPEGLSPAAVGYLAQRGYHDRLMTATILSLAGQGVLEVEKASRSDWTVRRTGPIPRSLPPDELSVAKTLLPDRDALVITAISRTRISQAKRRLRRQLKIRYHGRYFVANRWWFLLGLLASLMGFTVLVDRTPIPLEPSAWKLAAWLLIGGIATARVLTRGFRGWRIDLAEMSPKPSVLAASIFPLLALVPLGVLGGLAYDLYRMVPLHLFVSALVLSAINAVFFELLERPTEAGRRVLDHLEGLKRFLSATETGPLARLPSNELEQLYERLLPYAVALGLKNRWATLFDHAIDPVLPGT